MAGKTEYKNQWKSQNRDQIIIIVKKGEKEKIKAHAEKMGKSLNAYMNDLIKEDMKEGE
ncbi:MAG: antitoxin [Oscillospiraceae bacterium]|nr:antitoxin [Oscillospiraceae bacterium]